MVATVRPPSPALPRNRSAQRAPSLLQLLLLTGVVSLLADVASSKSRKTRNKVHAPGKQQLGNAPLNEREQKGCEAVQVLIGSVSCEKFLADVRLPCRRPAVAASRLDYCTVCCHHLALILTARVSVLVSIGRSSRC